LFAITPNSAGSYFKLNATLGQPGVICFSTRIYKDSPKLFCRFSQAITGQARIALGRGCLGVAQQFAD
jgi:hypothetical protein